MVVINGTYVLEDHLLLRWMPPSMRPSLIVTYLPLMAHQVDSVPWVLEEIFGFMSW